RAMVRPHFRLRPFDFRLLARARKGLAAEGYSPLRRTGRQRPARERLSILHRQTRSKSTQDISFGASGSKQGHKERYIDKSHDSAYNNNDRRLDDQRQ